MSGKNEDKTIIHCCVERDVYEMLIRHCEATGQTKTMAIRRAIREYCGKGSDGEEKGAAAASGGDD